MLEFVDSDLYFVQDKNNFINPLLQVRSGSVEKSTGSGGPKITGSGSSSLHYTILGKEYTIQNCSPDLPESEATFSITVGGVDDAKD